MNLPPPTRERGQSKASNGLWDLTLFMSKGLGPLHCKTPKVLEAWVHKGTCTPGQGVGAELEKPSTSERWREDRGVGKRDWTNPEVQGNWAVGRSHIMIVAGAPHTTGQTLESSNLGWPVAGRKQAALSASKLPQPQGRHIAGATLHPH